MSVAWTVYRGVGPVLGWLAPAARSFVPAAQRPLWGERLAAENLRPADAWIHAASLGEAGAVGPLVERLKSVAGGARFQLTATTLTGRERLAASGALVSLAPLDIPQASRRFFDQVQPGLVLLVETELWPHWLMEARRRGTPMVVVSARLSERSLRGYGRLGDGLRDLVAGLRGVLAQTDIDAERWRALGAQPDRVQVVGNLKDDGLPQPAADRAFARKALGLDPNRPLLVLGSVRPGEAATLAEAWVKLDASVRGAWQVVALPRHGAALDGLKREAEAAREWRWEPRMGVLNTYYRAAEVAFVGGSLEPFGGHNPMEPAATGAAVLMGGHYDSQRAAVETLQRAGALHTVATSEQLLGELVELLGDPELRSRMGQAARDVTMIRRGAAERICTWLGEEALWPLAR